MRISRKVSGNIHFSYVCTDYYIGAENWTHSLFMLIILESTFLKLSLIMIHSEWLSELFLGFKRLFLGSFPTKIIFFFKKAQRQVIKIITRRLFLYRRQHVQLILKLSFILFEMQVKKKKVLGTVSEFAQIWFKMTAPLSLTYKMREPANV